MAPRRMTTRAGASASTTSSAAAGASTSAADSLRRTLRPAREAARKPSSSSSAASSSTAVASPATTANRRRRVVQKPPPGTRNITSAQSRLIQRAKEQFNARRADGSSALRSLPVAPNSPQVEGRVLTEAEKLQREVRDLMEDIGEDNRDPEYLKFLFSLDETMEEESDDSDFNEDKEEEDEQGEEEKGEGEKDGDNNDEEDSADSDASDSNDDSDDSECESMDDLEEMEEEEEGGNSAGRDSPVRSLLREWAGGDISGDEDEDDDYEPGVEELAEVREMERRGETFIRRLVSGEVTMSMDSSDDEDFEELELLEDDENTQDKLIEETLRTTEDEEEKQNKSLLRTTEYGECTVCAETTVVDPVGCALCSKYLGCRKCANRWYRSSKANADDEIAKCPFCRQLWPAAEPDVLDMAQIVKK